MELLKILVVAALLVAVPAAAAAEVIPISEVNEDDEDGIPILWQETVTVRGVVTIGTGVLAENTDIYIDDGTGGLNIVQPAMASPTVAPGDSVRVTGRVAIESGNRTSVRVETSVTPGARIEILSSGNPVPSPFELTAREVALGEEWEGRRVVVRDVELAGNWQSGECAIDQATFIADGDTSCRMWFDADTDLCGSPEPLGTFDVRGVVIPRPRFVSSWRGHGVLPPARADVLSHGSGAGFADVEPARVFAGATVRLAFALRGEADALTRVTVAVPDGWEFSGSEGDVILDGPGFAGASVDGVATTPDLVVVDDCALAAGAPGTIELAGLVAPDSAGEYEFVIGTAVAGEEAIAIGGSPSVVVAGAAEPGAVLINEIIPSGNEYLIEYYNPDRVDVTGWVVALVSGTSDCEIETYAPITAGAVRSQGDYVIAPFGPSGEGAPQEPPAGADPSGGGDRPSRTLLHDAYTALLLYTDESFTYLIDAVEFRDPVFYGEDPCPAIAGLGGPDDAWAPAPIPDWYSLGRDELSTDTDVSAEDLHLSSSPTPGEANVPFDTLPPDATFAREAGSEFAVVVFNEPVDRSDAEDSSSYAISGGVESHRAWLSRDERTVLIRTDPQSPDSTYTVTIAGVSDLAGNLMTEQTTQLSVLFEPTVPIADVQASDENGYSLLVGQPAAVVGFTTVPPGVFQADRTNMYVQDLDGWGINVYRNALLTDPPIEGDLVGATGQVVDYVSSTSGAGATTEIDAERIEVIARGFDLVQPSVLPTGDVGREENEGALIRSSGVVVSVEGFAFYIDDGSGAIQVYQNFSDLDFGVFAVGDSVDVTGVVLQYDRTLPYFSGYELAPRYPSDMTILEAHYAAEARVSAMARVLDQRGGEGIEIRYNAPEASQVTVRIYDLKGREVTTLYSGLCLGPQRVVWDGRDENGSDVPSGVYLCHVQSRDRSGAGGGDAAVPVVVGRKLD
jgi:hypothetical protein